MTTSSARAATSRLSARRGPPSLKTRVMPRRQARPAPRRAQFGQRRRARRARPRSRSRRRNPRLGLRDALAGDDQRRRLARGGGEARAARQAQTRVQNHAQRLATLKSRQAHGEQRIVDRGRAMADHDRVVQRRSIWVTDSASAPVMKRRGSWSAPGGVAVRRLGELQSDHRPPLRHPQNMAEMIGARPASARTPVVTSTPASRSRAWPRPATRGSGSSSAETTRAMPAAMIVSTQGGVAP